MIENTQRSAMTADWLRKPLHCLLWWVVPVAMAVFVDHITRGWISVLAWSLALAWMATGCLLNARSCHRRHCQLSWPILLAGAVILALEAVGVLTLGSIGINAVLWTVFGLLLLSFVPELIWGRYVGCNSARDRKENQVPRS